MPHPPEPFSTTAEHADLVVIGAGAAGLAAAIFAARRVPGMRAVCVDGARRIGAKILVSGGSRCNVTNRTVTERDFWGTSSRAIRDVLRAFPANRAVEFFESLGVMLREEEDGKLFPTSNSSRTVLDGLLGEAARCGVRIDTEQRVRDVRREDGAFVVETAARRYIAPAAVLATGGRSLPKTGSDGFGYELARRLGHAVSETTPALAPLVLGAGPHRRLSGVSHRAGLTLRSADRALARQDGALLWTHFGISGPAALNLSRHWHHAQLAGRPVDVFVNVCPGETFASLEAWWLEQETVKPRARVSTVIATRIPAAVADAWCEAARIDAETTVAHLDRVARRRLVHALLDTRLDVRDSRGFAHAEVTAGGVPLEEIDSATMESRRCERLYLVGEILDVDGRLGGFNFQWAWSSGRVAGDAIARAMNAQRAAGTG